MKNKSTKYTQINTNKSRLCTVKCTQCDKTQSGNLNLGWRDTTRLTSPSGLKSLVMTRLPMPHDISSISKSFAGAPLGLVSFAHIYTQTCTHDRHTQIGHCRKWRNGVLTVERGGTRRDLHIHKPSGHMHLDISTLSSLLCPRPMVGTLMLRSVRPSVCLSLWSIPCPLLENGTF